MFDKYEVWQYRETANCWDYVRSFLVDKTDLSDSDIPRFGVHPDDIKAKTGAHDSIVQVYPECDPVDYAIACHYFKNALLHVGVVYNGSVWHTSKQWGTTKHSLEDYERLRNTVYRLHKKLWLS